MPWIPAPPTAVPSAGGNTSGRWEVVVDGVPAEAVTNEAQDDWLYAWVDSEPGDGSAVTVQPIRVTFDGGGSAITTGAKQVYLSVPFACTVVRWRLLADQPGDLVVDVWKDAYSSFPPTVADTIAGSDKPTLSSAQAAESAALTGWDTDLAAGDVLEFNIDSAATVAKAILELWVAR